MTSFPLQFSQLALTSIRQSASPVRANPSREIAIAPPPQQRTDRPHQHRSNSSATNAGDRPSCPETRPCPRPSSGGKRQVRILVGTTDGRDGLFGNVDSQRCYAAHLNAQTKGRIERLFETLQDRLVKEMRLAGIATIEAANRFLEIHFLPEWERRFAVLPRHPRNVHRPLGREQRLEEILSVRAARQVADDHTVSWDGNCWGVPREEVCAGLRGAQVEIERRLDGSHWLRFRGRYLSLRPCPDAVRSASPSGLRPPGLADQSTKHPKTIKPKYHVPADHPWRKPWRRTLLSGTNPDISTLR
jgi:hypothetical protein